MKAGRSGAYMATIKANDRRREKREKELAASLEMQDKKKSRPNSAASAGRPMSSQGRAAVIARSRELIGDRSLEGGVQDEESRQRLEEQNAYGAKVRAKALERR
jgi:hypothetical protein